MNALRREIDRLLRGIDRFDIQYPFPPDTNVRRDLRSEPAAVIDPGATDHRRKLYAPPALGQPLAIPPAIALGAVRDLLNVSRVTNLGTRVDVLI